MAGYSLQKIGFLTALRISLACLMAASFGSPRTATSWETPTVPSFSAKPLFISAEPNSFVAQEAQDPSVLRRRFVSIDDSILEKIGGSERRPVSFPRSILLNLFEGQQQEYKINKVGKTSTGALVLSGSSADSGGGSVVMAYRHGVLEGIVTQGSCIVTISYAGEGIHVIKEVNQEELPSESEPSPISDETMSLDLTPSFIAAPMADDGSVIDVLVVYTPTARDARGGASGILNLIDLAVEQTNTTYANSGVSQRINLVHTAEVSYTETGDLNTDLYRLYRKDDGYMDDVHSLRDEYCADNIVLIVDDGGNSCGMSYQMWIVLTALAPYALSVVADECAVGNLSFSHELGHTMGPRHDWYVDDTTNSPYTYNHGYVNASQQWRTIMAYNTECANQGISCTRLPYWSNPNLLYEGSPLGVPEGEINAADNRKTLNNTAYVVSNFRESCSAASPSASFSAAATSGLAPLQVTFTNTSTGDISSYAWDFGDGDTSTEANPVHGYQEAGTYTVSLTVEGSGGSDTVIEYDYITVYKLHDADTEAPAWSMDGNEVNRVLSYWRAGGYHCDASGLDGFAAGSGDTSCDLHCADYLEPDWVLDGQETGRVLAYWRAGGYHPDETGADGYAPGLEGAPLGGALVRTTENGFQATHSMDGDYYQAGGAVTVDTEVTYTGNLLSLMWRPAPPEGWEIQSVSGDGNPELSGGDILWTGSLPPSPVSMSYVLQVPPTETRDCEIRNEVLIHLPGEANPSAQFVDPDPLFVAPEKPFNPSGIYKTLDNSVNVFLQTYDEGSMLVLFTSDLVNFQAFLVPEWGAGVEDVPDMAGLGRRLSLDFADDVTLLATVAFPGGSEDSRVLSRVFDFSASDDAPDGIYKTLDQSMNTYIQTYSTGSLLAILTPDLMNWLVFLDPDWRDGISVSGDLAETGRALTMTEKQSGSYTAAIYEPSGGSTKFDLEIVFPAQE